MTPLRWAQRFDAPTAQLAELPVRFPPATVSAARASITDDQHALIERFLTRAVRSAHRTHPAPHR
jgi:hypothetical protein